MEDRSTKNDLEQEREELIERMRSLLSPEVALRIEKAISFPRRKDEFQIVTSTMGSGDADLS